MNTFAVPVIVLPQTENNVYPATVVKYAPLAVTVDCAVVLDVGVT